MYVKKAKHTHCKRYPEKCCFGHKGRLGSPNKMKTLFDRRLGHSQKGKGGQHDGIASLLEGKAGPRTGEFLKSEQREFQGRSLKTDLLKLRFSYKIIKFLNPKQAGLF